MIKPLSGKWTAEERLRVISAMLPELQNDIHMGRYSEPGRPNITSIQHVIMEPAEVLEEYREDFEGILKRAGEHPLIWMDRKTEL